MANGRGQRRLEEEIRRIEAVRAEHGLGRHEGVVTSRDPMMSALRETLMVEDTFPGFSRWLLPFVFNPGQGSIVVGAPNTETPPHSHPDQTLHVVMSGTVWVGGAELTAGDWAYIPPGVTYSLRTGPLGATMLYPHFT